MAFISNNKQAGFAIPKGPMATPFNPGFEKTALTALAANSDKIFMDNVTHECFHEARNKAIFDAIEALSRRTGFDGDRSITSAEIINFGLSKQIIAEMGGQNYIEEVIDAKHSETYINNAFVKVKDYAMQRRTIAVAEHLKHAANGKSVDEIMEIFNQSSNELMRGIGISPPKTAKTVISSILEEYRDYQSNKQTSGLYTGIGPIDTFLNGVKPCYWVLGALSSTGKTSLAIAIFYNMVLQGKKVIFFSQEMTSEELVKKILAMVAHIGVGSTNSGIMTPHDFAKAELKLKEIQQLLDDNAEIYDDSAMTVADIRSKSMAFQRRHGKIDAIFVDYLQSIDIEGYSAVNEAAKVQEISKKLKGLGKDLGCLMFALSQLTPSGDANGDPTPFMLRGSRQIMQDADIILLMSRKEHRNDRNDGCDIISGNFCKGRSVGEAKIEMKFNTKYMTFDFVKDTDYSDPGTFDNSEWVHDNSSEAVKQPTKVETKRKLVKEI